MYLSRCLSFCSGLEVKIKLLLDSSSARQILSRSGVGRIRHLSVKELWLQQKGEAKEIHVSAVGTADNIADLGTKRLNCNTTRYLMHLCGVFDGSELVGKAEFEQMQRKRMVNRLAGNQNLLQVNQRILQLALMMHLSKVIDGLSNFHFNSTNALSPQFVVLGATEWLQVAVVILVVATLVMVGYYRYVWKCSKADSDHWLEISEKLASHQHSRAMEGLHEFRAFSRRRRRRLAFGRRVDMNTPADQLPEAGSGWTRR